MEGIRKAMNERNLNEDQWEDRKQWSLGVRQGIKRSESDIYIYIYIKVVILKKNYFIQIYGCNIVRFSLHQSCVRLCYYMNSIYCRTQRGDITPEN